MTIKIVCYPAEAHPVFPNTSGDQYVADLGVYEGKQYLALSEGVAFPKQPRGGVPVKEADLKDEGLQKYLKTECPPARQIDMETQLKIRERYSLESELKALRTKDMEYEAYVDSVVAEGRDKKTALGLLIKSEVEQ